jgi:hypothetical protein
MKDKIPWMALAFLSVITLPTNDWEAVRLENIFGISVWHGYQAAEGHALCCETRQGRRQTALGGLSCQEGSYWLLPKALLRQGFNSIAPVITVFDDFTQEQWLVLQGGSYSFTTDSLYGYGSSLLNICVQPDKPPLRADTVFISLVSDPHPHFSTLEQPRELYFPARSSSARCLTLKIPADTLSKAYNFAISPTHAGAVPQMFLFVEPCPGFAGRTRVICQGETTVIGCPGNPDYCYRWLPEEGLEYPDWPWTPASPSQTTVYTIYVTDQEDQLVGVDEVTVFVPITASVEPEIINVCPGETVTLNAIVDVGGENLTYSWQNGETTASITFKPSRSGYHWVDVHDNESGCTVRAEALINLKRTPEIKIISTALSICELAPPSFAPRAETRQMAISSEACGPDSSWLYAGTGLSGYSYLWSTGDSGAHIRVYQAGTYAVTVTNPHNECLTVASIEIEFCAAPSFKSGINSSGKWYLDAGEGFYSYLWHDGSTGQTILLNGPGAYAVTVVDHNGCLAKAKYFIAGH